MIAYEPGATPVVRGAESVLSGRRIAGRLLPYGSETGAGPRLDPVDRRFVLGASEPVVRVGPHREGPWTEALARIPAGPVLVGPPAPGEPVWGAYAAAAGAAMRAGRPVFLLDPPEAIPGAGGRPVALCSWRPGRPGAAFPGLATARKAGLAATAIFPLLPGWTAEDDALDGLAAAAAAGGAVAFCGMVPVADGDGRRAIVAARAGVDPENADRFFEVIHHGDWPDRVASRLEAARAAAQRHGLASLPPRPAGCGQPAGNVEAAARLEELAELGDPGEHRAALLYAAVRWIDESARDLAAVARERNFPRIFPFEGEIRQAAEAALLAAR